ncbi:Predicted arabinose efflux permease, MFS family [Roseivivax halotolerans]|uniref:Predicted arabinose efflux permease, MFS family n=1 Tax=Roseivivax halotolerans TaxID=93684 RepID=A0A1I5YKK0_9RHOB|nr:MFS transporter [Roseivivax halotolerans]SFQ44751.1 Predicted arabinose efflux permease, MFS family [Roseivivax halotolerans]
MTDGASRSVIATLSACNFVIGMGAFVVIGLIDPMSEALSVSRSGAGWVMTIYAISYAIFSPLLVSATGRIGRRRVLALGMALFGVGMTGAALAPSMGWLLLARGVAAAGAGMFTPVSVAVAAALAAPEERGRVLAAVVFGLTLAQVAGVPAGGWIAFTFGWRVAFWLVAALAVVGIALVWTRVPRGLSFAPVSLSDLGRVIRDGIAMGAILYTASFLGSIFVLYTYIAPLLSETMGFGRDAITLTLVVFGVGAVLGNLLGGWMADNLGFLRTLLLLVAGQLLTMPLFSGLPYPVWALMALVFLWSILGWSFMAAQQVRLLGLAPEEASVVLALNAAAIYVGTACGSAFGGLVLDMAGIDALGIGASIAALWALTHILWSHRSAKLAGRES